MVNNKEKVIKKLDGSRVETGYYNDKSGKFILHSFDDEPSIIFNDGSEYWHKDGVLHRSGDLPAVECGEYKKWYDNGKRYWFVENEKYISIGGICEKYKDKIIRIKDNISQKLTDNNIDFIYLGVNLYENSLINSFLIINDSDRNEVILKYG